MTINLGKMRRGYDSQQRAGDFWSVPEGDTVVYIHPPCRGDDDEYEPTEGLNYAPVAVHYGVGKNNSMCVCLDSEINPIVNHPFVRAVLKKKKVKLNGKCPICQAIESGELDDDDADNSRVVTRYLWGLTPLESRDRPSAEYVKISPNPSVAFVGKTIYDGIMEIFFDNGDITDFDSAIFVRINREGKKMTDTRYKITAHSPTIKKPAKLGKKLAVAVTKAMKEGGDCDLFRVVASLIKSPEEASALLTGVKLERDYDGEDYGEDYDDEDEPEEEKDLDDDSEDEDEEDDERSAIEDEDEDNEDDDDELDELDAELARISKKKKGKAKR